MNKTRCLLSSAIVLLLSGTPLAGQVSFEVGPIGGLYRPTAGFVHGAVSYLSLPGTPQDLRSSAWGGEGRIWFGRRFGGQIQLLSAKSHLGPLIAPVGTSNVVSVHVTTFSLQALINVLGRDDGYRVWVSAGPGLVHHGGESYEAVGAQTDLAAAGGIGGSYPILGSLRATAGANMVFYSYNVAMPVELRANGASVQSGAQRDALFHIGLNWAWH